MNRNYSSFTLLKLVTVVSVSLLSACGSTMQEDELPTCRSDSPDLSSCPEESDKPEDRGYNPCLINKNLPVCKSSE